MSKNRPKCPLCGELLILDMNVFIKSHHCYPIHHTWRNTKMVDFDAEMCRVKCLLERELKKKDKKIDFENDGDYFSRGL